MNSNEKFVRSDRLLFSSDIVRERKIVIKRFSIVCLECPCVDSAIGSNREKDRWIEIEIETEGDRARERERERYRWILRKANVPLIHR